MGIFSKILGASVGFSSNGIIKSPLKDFIKDEDLTRPIQDLTRRIIKEKRKQIEEGAEKIHPLAGKMVKTCNNFGDTVENAQDSLQNGLIRKLFSPEVKELKLADHLFVQRIGYTHHGLYIGNGKVIHYLAECITEDSLETFADGAKVHKKSDSESIISYSRNTVVNRAYRRLYEDKYNLLVNNCESFVKWCRNGTDNY